MVYPSELPNVSAAKVVGKVEKGVLLSEKFTDMRWWKEPPDRIAEKSSELATAIIEKGVRGWYDEEDSVFILQQRRVRQYSGGKIEEKWINVPTVTESSEKCMAYDGSVPSSNKKRKDPHAAESVEITMDTDLFSLL